MRIIMRWQRWAEFCNPAAGWEKGRIEKNVQDARRRIWRRVPSFKTLEDLNTWLEQRCRALWQETRHPEHKDRWIAELWAEEREHLMPVPAPFDGFVEHTKSVSSTCLITHDHDRYSVPSSFANQPVSVRVYATRLAVVADARIVAEHERVFTRASTAIGKTVYDWRHYLGVARRKPGAVRNGAPFMGLPDSFKRLRAHLLKRPGGDREMVEILALVLHHDERKVEEAVTLALGRGPVSKLHITNILMRLIEEPRPAPLTPPLALKLVNEPLANTQRYDRLREKSHAD